MTDERWPRVKALFQSVVERPTDERDSFLAAATGDDEALRREVESLLTADASDAGVLDQMPVVSESLLVDPPARSFAALDHTLSHPVMAPGLRAGLYEIVAPLGTGSMGEVYRAWDTKLNREVALKVLPRLFALDPDRLARFTREAQLLARLNHPNIAAIYGLEESDGAPALVLELVDGLTLAERIADGPIRLAEVLTIARQIADALEAAHEKGIIHRDIKPANVAIARNGIVKVLDFGLARVWDGAPQSGLSGSPRLTVSGMGEQTILGTPAYMSPEQARCKSLDKRTDVWSFGCVLYEMLTGRAAFGGETISDTIAAILERESDGALLPANTPLQIRHLLRRCLEKDRDGRLDSLAGARAEIDDAIASPASGTLARASKPSQSTTRVTLATLASGTALAAFIAWLPMRPVLVTPTRPARFAIVTAAAEPLNVSGSNRDLAVAPDGRHLVYRFGGSITYGSPLMIRAIHQLDGQPLQDVDSAYAPFFSPDSRWVGFFEAEDLKKVSTSGGPIVTLHRFSGTPLGASWGDDNTITFATSSPITGLSRVSADGGEATVLTAPDPAQREGDHLFPSVLPRGRGVLYTIAPAGEGDSSQVAVLDLKTGQRKTLIRGGSDGRYVETGHLIFAAAGTLRAVRFDPIGLEVLSDPVTVVEHVMMKPSGAANFAVSRAGTLVYVPGEVAGAVGAEGALRSLVWVDRRGHEDRIDMPARAYGPPRISPDGTSLAFGIAEQGNTEIWIGDLIREELRQLTFARGMNGLPVWTPDSRRIVFMSDRTGALNLYSQSADGTGTLDRITVSATPQWPTSITPDGTYVIGFAAMPATRYDVLRFALRGSGSRAGPDLPPTTNPSRAEPLVQSPFNEVFAEISPDGRYLAYESDESGRDEVYVRPYGRVDSGPWRISTGGGTRAAWARSGRELFYRDGSGTLTSVLVQTSGPTLSTAPPRPCSTPSTSSRIQPATTTRRLMASGS